MEDWDRNERFRDPRRRWETPGAAGTPGAAVGGATRTFLAFLGWLAMAVLAGVLLGIVVLLTLLFGAGCWLTGVLISRERLKARAWGPVRDVTGRARAFIRWIRTPASSEDAE
jgi:hypothetical protein